jgi:DNA primase
MSFPPRFLDELRERLTLSEVIGRRVRVTRAGREFKACCPFHHEKTPSFTINDQKGFFHCFGCGAHGDVVGFVMRHDNLSFPEAVEFLASAAGLQVPETTAEDRQKAEKQKTLYDLVERACKWFEAQLHEPGGRAARGYLVGRGLTEEATARFRLGFAPNDRHGLVRALKAEGFPEDDMIAAGLARRPEDGGAVYSFFRNRVMFPVADRRGRIVAFGGRIMEGDGPKYVNTSETPLFHKGALLYGLSRARQAAANGQPVVVAEGYMDVIALVEAGFGAAVAPLGTALTELQIQELWKLIPRDEKEPYLCFDGDSAGRRAAWRAVERFLPHLGPGKSARVAFLPQGQDPDSLIRAGGAKAMTEVLDNAIPLSEALWRMESEERRTDTPETKAALRAALDARVNTIADPAVKEYYRQDMRRRMAEALTPPSPQKNQQNNGFIPRNAYTPGGWGQGRRPGQPPRRHVAGLPGIVTAPPPGKTPDRRRLAGGGDVGERLLLATLINHPALFDEVGEALGMLSLPPGPLEGLRAATVNALSRDSGLDADVLCRHLADCGHDPATLLTESYVHGKFARSDASLDEAREGWFVTWGGVRELAVRRDLGMATEALRRDASEANLARLQGLREELRRLTGAMLGDEDAQDGDETFD